MSISRMNHSLEQTYDNDDRFAPPSSAQVIAHAKCTAKPYRPISLTAAAPARRTFFDPWNSSSTGHQRAENRLSGSTSWRISRSLKLNEQYRSGLSGGKRVADIVGAGSEDFGKDGRKGNSDWKKGTRGLGTVGQQSLAEIWSVSKTSKKFPLNKTLQAEHDPHPIQGTVYREGVPKRLDVCSHNETDFRGDIPETLETPFEPREKQLFEGFCFYVNGSTAPLVSYHKLKHLLAAHGARHSVALSRRTVTHVILGTVSTSGGAGGGLAATKIQKELSRTRGKAVKYITVEWVLESIKASRRLSESRFAPLKLVQKTQGSLCGMMDRRNVTKTAHG